MAVSLAVVYLFTLGQRTSEAAGTTITISDVGGNWDSAEAWVGGIIPTSMDDVIASATSGPLTINAAASCRSIDLTSYTNTLTHNAAVALAIGDASGGALNFTGAWTYSKGSDTTSEIKFISTSNNSNNGWPITWGEKTPGNIAFNAVGGKWKYQDGYTNTAQILTLTAGELDINSQSIGFGSFSPANSASAIMTLTGNSNLTLSGAWANNNSAWVLNKGESTITLNGGQKIFWGSGKTYNNVILSGSLYTQINGSSTFANLTRTATESKTDLLILAADQTVTSSFAVSGNSSINRILVQSTPLGTARTITAANVVASNVDFMDITAAGAANWDLSAISGAAGDCGGNSGITFTTGETQTWTNAAGGSWSEAANWSGRVPLPQDPARFQAMSAGQTIAVDMPRLPDTDFSNVANTPTVNLTTSGMLYSLYGNMNLTGVGTFATNDVTVISHTDVAVTSNGKSFRNFNVNVAGATVTLVDNFTLIYNLTVNSGTLSTNSNMDINSFLGGSGTTTNMGSGTWTNRGGWGGYGTVNGGTSTLLMTYNGAAAMPFAGSSTSTYNNIVIAPGTGVLTFERPFTFANLTMSSAGAKTIKFTKDTTYTMTGTNFLNGTAGNLVTISSTETNAPFTLSKASGRVFADCVSMQDATAAGGAKWYLTSGSTDISGNTGWTNAKTISSTGGLWNAAAAWTNGILPTAADEVFGLANSGPLTINAAAACRSIDLSSYTKTLTHNSGFSLTVGDATGGELNFSGAWTYTKGSATTSAINFVSTSNNGGDGWNITWGGKTPGNVTFNGVGGKWKYMNGYTNTSQTLALTAGELDVNGQTISISTFTPTSTPNAILTLGNSNITVVRWNTATLFVLNCGTSTITWTGTGTSNRLYVTGKTFYNVVATGAGDQQISGAGTFANLTRTGNATKTNGLYLDSSITVTGTITLTGNSAINRLLLYSSVLGTARTLSAAHIAVSNVDVQDITFAGEMQVNSTSSVGDCGGNSGTNWDSIVTPAASQTWTNAAGGNWSTASNWTSRVPLPQDDAIMNRVGGYNSGVAVTADMPRLGRTIDWTGATWNGSIGKLTAAYSSSIRIFGSLILVPNMNTFEFANQQTTWYFSGRSSYIIDGGSDREYQSSHFHSMIIEAPGGTYTLANGLYTAGSNTGSTLTINSGTFVSAGHDIWTTNFTSSSSTVRTVDISNSSVRFNNWSKPMVWNFATTTGLTFNAAGSKISATYSGATASTFSGGNLTYNDIELSPGTGVTTFSGSFTFANLSMKDDAEGAKTVKFTRGTTYTMTGTRFLSGSIDNLITIDTNDGTGQFTLSKATGIAAVSYVSISRSNVTGGAKWYMSQNSVAVIGNTGWLIDNTMPINPAVSSVEVNGNEVNDGDAINYFGFSNFNFSGATDADSGIVGYYISVKTNDDDDYFYYQAHLGSVGDLQTWNDYIPKLDGAFFYLTVKTEDAVGNVSDPVILFRLQYDLTLPTRPSFISSTPAGYSTNNSFSLSWPAGTDPNGLAGGASGIKYYEYKREVDNTWFHTESAEILAIPNVEAYQEGANLFFVRSVDNAGNISSSYQQVSYYWLGEAPSMPTNLTVSPDNSNSNSFTVSWNRPNIEANDPMIVGYYYSVNAVPTMSNVTYIPSADEHISIGPDAFATKQGLNTIYVLAVNQAGQYSLDASNYASGNFTCLTPAQPAPTQASLVDSSDSSLNRWMLTLQWAPGEGQDSAFSHYIIYRSTNGLGFTALATTGSTAFIDASNLNNSTTYYYNVKAVDNAGKESAQSSIVSKMPAGKYQTPPEYLSQPSASGIKATSANITWVTNRSSNTVVRYGKSASSLTEFSGQMDSVINHAVELNGLDPATIYYYQTQSMDENRDYEPADAYSQVYSFFTLSAPAISGVNIENVTLTSADISFSTTTVSNSTINYGESSTYNKSMEDKSGSSSTDHKVKLSELTPGTTYHFKITGTDIDGNKLNSDDYTLTTLSLPSVSDLKTEIVPDQPSFTVKLIWKSNVETTTVLRYASKDGETHEKVSAKLTSGHETTLSDLVDNATYSIQATGRDQFGNEATSSILNLDTPTDSRPPKIDSLNVESRINGDNSDSKSQIIVSWHTDELATSQVEYGEGTGGEGYGSSTQEFANLTHDHLVIISDLDNQKPYHIRAVSKDASGNLAHSENTVVVTKKPGQAAFTLIIDTLSKSFSFLNKIFGF